ncbi:hypothetical protein HRG_009219 [Hirsutella rhossiliensis]|uniref:Uncharacterized protein n=1 Tax=Hirsutella rhossiliensis TaxID=111463 RepID=A0A9P8MQW6_9HYPO|nr:uncharacterized protein HRG_09219 [Hirsutella rhossiliensis]KAH0959437.1 hypothetical protein HRG_09219 [Hirsutella rhossiliensis]
MPPPPSAEDAQGGVPTQPLIWIIVPLLSVFSVGCFVFFMWRRHQRARDPNGPGWADDRVIGPGGFLVARTSRRWATLGGTRPLEGLNELGEAPPPYEAKTPPPPLAEYPRVVLPEPEGEAEGARGRPPGYCHAVPQNQNQQSQQNQQQPRSPPEAHTAPPSRGCA